MQLLVALVDGFAVRAMQLGAGDLAALDQRGGLFGGQTERVDQCPSQ
jgi:hypothetical protein